MELMRVEHPKVQTMLRNAKRQKKNWKKENLTGGKKSLSNRNPGSDIILHNSRNLHSDQPPWELPSMSIYSSTARGTDSAWNITHRVIQHFNLLAFSIIKENNQECVFTLNWERIIWKKRCLKDWSTSLPAYGTWEHKTFQGIDGSQADQG